MGKKRKKSKRSKLEAAIQADVDELEAVRAEIVALDAWRDVRGTASDAYCERVEGLKARAEALTGAIARRRFLLDNADVDIRDLHAPFPTAAAGSSESARAAWVAARDEEKRALETDVRELEGLQARIKAFKDAPRTGGAYRDDKESLEARAAALEAAIERHRTVIDELNFNIAK